MADDPRPLKLYASDPSGGEPSLSHDGSRDPVGALLRRTRENFGQELRDVSDTLRIRYAYLDAIERSAFEELPGPTYAIGFVRSYAQYLGLDDDEIVRRFKEESQGLKRDQELHFPAPVNEGKLPSGVVLLLSLVLIAVAYGAWTFLNNNERTVAELVQDVPQRLQELVGAEEQPQTPSAPQLAEVETQQSETAADAQAATSETAESDGFGDTPAPDSTDGAGVSGQTSASGTVSDPDPDSGSAAPETNSLSDEVGGETESITSVPDAPDIPDVPSAESPDVAADDAPSETASVQSSAPENTAADNAAGDRPSERSLTSQAPDDTSQTPDEENTVATDDTAPPEVPELQQDESGIPTAPEQTQTAAADATQDGRVFGADAANSRVTLRATARSWVQVRGPDDTLELTRMLQAGDIYRVPDRSGLLLHTGNAGGLEVVVDGANLGTLGDTGEVRRGIVLEPDALR